MKICMPIQGYVKFNTSLRMESIIYIPLCASHVAKANSTKPFHLYVFGPCVICIGLQIIYGKKLTLSFHFHRNQENHIVSSYFI